jgi:hypothetical protein
LEPIKYLRRADNNFFGGRTTWYNQIDSQLNEKNGITIENKNT